MRNNVTENNNPRETTGYPRFSDPKKYLKLRQPPGALGVLKALSERRALDGCLDRLERAAAPGRIGFILDIPCGPGRLYRCYRDRGFHVVGADLGPEMLDEAARLRRELDLPGAECRTDAFHLPWPDDSFDTVISVRFAYYFDQPQRIALIRELARVSRHGIVVQVKIAYSMFSRIRKLTGKAARRNRGKFLQQRDEIIDDFRRAGLAVERIAPLSRLRSDRAFVLALL